MSKRSILGPLPPLPLPRFRFRFHQNVVILLVAIPPTYLEAADKSNRFRFRFQNTADEKSKGLQNELKKVCCILNKSIIGSLFSGELSAAQTHIFK